MVAPLPGGEEVPRLLAALAARPFGAALDSAGGAPRRWSLVALAALPEALVGAPPRTLLGLRDWLAGLAPEGAEAVPGPFASGFVGALAYDLGVAGEDQVLPPPAWPNPPLVGGLVTDFVTVEHGPDGAPLRAWLVLGDFAADPATAARAAGCVAPLAERRAEFLSAFAAAPADPASAVGAVRALGPLVRTVPAEEHVRRVRAVQAHIGRGECYQANLAHRYERAVAGDPTALYLRLRALAPAPYMGLVRWPAEGAYAAGALLSASPELLLEVERDGALRTRPIKGTAPRGRDADEDGALRAALLASAKDRAELAMIVDLERNDLARVAAPGSVRVSGFPTVETYRNVHHLVADVHAELAPERDAVDALAALFPGGSITGAPKVASMAVIAELEREGRGFFTGSLGCLDVLGRARFSVLIRTLVHRPGEVSFHVGGGITWRSEPEAEERETRVKGAALAAATSAVEQGEDTLGAVLAPTGSTAAAQLPAGASATPGTPFATPSGGAPASGDTASRELG